MVAKNSGDAPRQAACLTALRRLGSATVTDLAAAAGVSRPTAEFALVRLDELGLVERRVEQVQPHVAGGRPARVSRFRPGTGYVAGVDLVGATIKVAISDLSGRWVATGPLPTPVPTEDRPELEPVAAAIHAALDSAGIDRALLRAVGVGVSGVAQSDGHMSTSPLVLPWTGRNIGDELTALLETPTMIDNDLTLAAIAETRTGALVDVPTAVYAQTWPHVSARILVDGEVVRGRSRVAGEIGGVRSFSDTIDFPSAAFLDDLAMFEQAFQGLRERPDDAELLDVRDRLVAGMTPSITALVLAVDPDVVVLGGQLGRYADLVADLLDTSVHDFIVRGPAVGPTFTGAQLVDEGVLMGAVDQAFARFSTDVYGLSGVTPPQQSITDVPSPQEAVSS